MTPFYISEIKDTDRKIVLSDGSTIHGYDPIKVDYDIEREFFKIIENGGYVASGKESVMKNGKPFYSNAFFLLRHSKEILSDSRMFLSHVPPTSAIQDEDGGIAYPTLGVFVEWWRDCKASTVEMDGRKWLVWNIPNGQSDFCYIVSESGEVCRYKHPKMNEVVLSLTLLASRYKDVKQGYAWFTLEEVLCLLQSDTDMQKRKLIQRCFYLRCINAHLNFILNRERTNIKYKI